MDVASRQSRTQGFGRGMCLGREQEERQQVRCLKGCLQGRAGWMDIAPPTPATLDPFPLAAERNQSSQKG